MCVLKEYLPDTKQNLNWVGRKNRARHFLGCKKMKEKHETKKPSPGRNKKKAEKIVTVVN